MTTTEDWTIARLLSWTRDFLAKRGSESPRLDAEVLLAHVLGCPRVQLYTNYETVPADEPRSRFRELVRKRSEGAPVAYLVGRKEFFSLPLAVSPAVLIPRPDSEFAVVELLHALRSTSKPLCVDVGTGSGALALAALHQHPTARFLAVDVSEDALAVARSNAETLGLAPRIRYFHGDLLAPVADQAPFDAIISNPPYIGTEELDDLEPGVRDYEPHLALDGGPGGLEVVRRLVRDAIPMLKPGGHLVLEIGSAQEAPVRELLGGCSEIELAPTVKDGAGHPRVIRGVKKG